MSDMAYLAAVVASQLYDQPAVRKGLKQLTAQLRDLMKRADVLNAEIQDASLEELETINERLDRAIADPSEILVKGSTADTPERADQLRLLLLERKRLVLDRIVSLKVESSLQEARLQIESVGNEGDRGVVDGILTKAENAIAQIQRERLDLNALTDRVRTDAQNDLMLKVRVFEQKWEVWRKILARESVATIVGGILLVVLSGVLVVAMFSHTQVTEIISSSFLLILGFFFGQTTASRSRSGEEV